MFDEEGFVVLEIAKVIERAVTTSETDVAGFTFVPALEELLGPPPPDDGSGGETTSAEQKPARQNARKADNRAARQAALRAEREAKAAEKKSVVEQRLAERAAAAARPRRRAGEAGRPKAGHFRPRRANGAAPVAEEVIGPAERGLNWRRRVTRQCAGHAATASPHELIRTTLPSTARRRRRTRAGPPPPAPPAQPNATGDAGRGSRPARLRWLRSAGAARGC